MHQHPGLAGAGAGQHQLPAQAGRDGLALGIVEGGDQEFGVVLHRGILGGGGGEGKPGAWHIAARRPVDDRQVTLPGGCRSASWPDAGACRLGRFAQMIVGRSV
ncbi:hypothetical protein D3C86_1635490 [compost metagenome]